MKRCILRWSRIAAKAEAVPKKYRDGCVIFGNRVESPVRFRENGINECINMNYCKVPNYVVSATNVYTIVKSGSPNR